ncbi:hypothetical protein Vretimale_2988 [Volvox reticuliferus]|uniref:Uncharacterized protein n=1 Tax=Volvox reticuliferus TaxID=1737510 RepID=A0A8J4DCE9_9CHLO|nr:hypothetical protein Vretifemale_6888 [Volvox reticuliferus]GIL97267.1 hypothetical protein Vretimale_2988 [Volvox reticuliferus]
MTSRRTIGNLLLRAAHGTGQEGREAAIKFARIVCARGTFDDGAISRDGAQLVSSTHADKPFADSGGDSCSSSSSCQSQPHLAPLLNARLLVQTPKVLGRTTGHSGSSLAPPSQCPGAPFTRCGLSGGAAAPFSAFAAAQSVADSGAAAGSMVVDTSVTATTAATAATAATNNGGSNGAVAVGDAALLSRRAQLADSLAVCLGMQQLDALLARPENLAAVDEMLLLTALDVAHRLCASVSASVPPAPTSALAASVKSSAEAASDVLTRLSELLIQRLSEPGALSAEGAVRALRTLSMLRFNPAGDYAGLQTMAAFYREAVLPQLDVARLSADHAARTPQLLADLFFAFSRLFDVASRREKELQNQLLAAQITEEEAAASREDTSGAGNGDASLPPWERTAAASAAAGGYSGSGPAAVEDLVVLGDRQLYSQLCKMLSTPGILANVPSRTLGTLATAMATARFTHFPLAQSIATQTLLRLQGTGLAGAAAAAGVRMEGQPIANDAMATSTLSNILSCLARLGYEHEALCDAVANWMLQRLQGSPAAVAAGSGGVATGPGGSSSRGSGMGGIEPHHVVDVAVAFVRTKYENMDFLLRASEVLQLKLPQANPQSVSMMTWAIANSKCGQAPEFDGVLAALAQRMVALHRYSMTASGSGSGAGLAVLPRHLACMVFALARLGHKHVRLMDAAAADVMARTEKYQARQLVSILRAFTLLDEYVPDMYDKACNVLTSRLRALEGQSATALAAAPPAAEYVFTAQHYADAAWAVAMSGHAPRVPELMHLLATRIVEVAPQLGKACVVRAAQAFAVAGTDDSRLMEALAQASRPLLVDLGPEYLAALVGAFAEGQHPVNEEFWLACMDAVGLKVPHLERPRRDMQLATWRLCDAFRRHPATQQFPACRDHYVLPLLDALVESQQQMLAQQ